MSRHGARRLWALVPAAGHGSRFAAAAANAAPKRTPRFAGDVTTNMTSNAAIPVLEMPVMEFSSK